jgi:hypothetical protein
MKLHLAESMVEIAGRLFPASGVICPLHETRPEADEPEWERRFSGRGGGTKVLPEISYTVHIPTENGLLIEIEEGSDNPGLLDVKLFSRTCEETFCTAEPKGWLMYVPRFLTLDGAEIIEAAGPTWRNAEPEWVAEFIDRVSKMPYQPTPGPQVKLITLAALAEMETVQ